MFLPAFMRSEGTTQVFLQIELAPAGTDSLTSTSSRQDRELQRERRNVIPRPQTCHEAGQLIVGHCRVMLDAADLAFCWQQVIEMATPAGRVLARRESCAPWPNLKIDSIRPRSLDAVSGLSPQIGSRTLSTKAVSIACTGNAPMMGLA